MHIYQQIVEKKKNGQKQFAVLVDPDKVSAAQTSQLAQLAMDAGVDYFFVGGSLLTNDNVSQCIKDLKAYSNIPVVLFPGNPLQINNYADAILFLSLISGRNPEMLIGNHVIAAPLLKQSSLEVIPTGYMLIESGKPTAVSYMSNTTPIPSDKKDIALCTAMAGELLGLKLIFMDGGSGAHNPISTEMITAVSQNIRVPLIIGGGIHTPEKAYENCKAGADLIVIGNAIERSPLLMGEIAATIGTVKC